MPSSYPIQKGVKMSSKKQTHNNKTISKQRLSKSTSGNLDILAQQQPNLDTVIQRASHDPSSLTPCDMVQLQHAIGNRVVSQLLAQSSETSSMLQGQTIQRETRDEDNCIAGLDMATCSLVGVGHNETHSFATVRSEAYMSSPTHRVVYEIKWDAAVVPGGRHLGQIPNQASDWVVDKSVEGVPIGDREGLNAPYFNNDIDMRHELLRGRYFYFNDPIQQHRLRGGSWWFRLKVVDENNQVLSQSHAAEVPWGE